MQILLINEYLEHGGAELFNNNLKTLLKSHGHEVDLLVFNLKGYQNQYKDVYCVKSYSKLNKILWNPFLYIKYRKILAKVKPDIVIVNNIFSAPVTLLRALSGYRAYQVIHDYKVICPKATCLTKNGQLCSGRKGFQCMRKCGDNIWHKSILLLKLMAIMKLDKLRNKYILKCIVPSEKLSSQLHRYGYKSIVINNPLDLSITKKFKTQSYEKNKRTFVYVGRISEIKGIYKAINYFKQFSPGKNIFLDIYGMPENNQEEKMLIRSIAASSNINWRGKLAYEEVLIKIRDAYCLLVPSKGMENYPTTVLEGMALGTLVLASNHGGMQEMLGNGRGVIFDYDKEEDMLDKLKYIFNLDSHSYQEIVVNAQKYVEENNSFDVYYNKLMHLISEE